MYGVPQGAVVGPLLFHISQINLFLKCDDNDINSYVADFFSISCAKDMSSVIAEL